MTLKLYRTIADCCSADEGSTFSQRMKQTKKRIKLNNINNIKAMELRLGMVELGPCLEIGALLNVS
jgi:hypothetical protein